MAIRAFISGKVQGVGYRAFTERAARDRGVAGWVRNLPDGRVEAHLEGDAATLEALLEDLRKGPRFGRVSGVVTNEVSDTGHTAFEIVG